MIDVNAVEPARPSERQPLWAYAYQFLPPRPTDRMGPLLDIVHRENAGALRDARTWTARLVTETHVTHVLVLSDDPDLDRDTNRKLEAMLRELDIPYSVTLPMRVDDHEAPRTATP